MRHQFLRAATTLRDAILSTATTATLSYIAAVEAADSEQLEDGALAAMVSFANWRIPLGGACCMFAGPRTLAGKLTPMVGAAPTVVKPVDGDVDVTRRHISLNGVDQYIALNVNGNAIDQDDRHAYVFLTEPRQGVRINNNQAGGVLSSQTTPDGTMHLHFQAVDRTTGVGGQFVGRCASDSANRVFNEPTYNDGWISADGVGISRQSGTTQEYLLQGVYVENVASTSVAPVDQPLWLSRQGNGHALLDIGAYSVGPWINLGELNTRVKAAMFAISSALAPQSPINVVLGGGQSNSNGLNPTTESDPLVPAWLDGVTTLDQFSYWRSDAIISPWSLQSLGRFGSGKVANSYSPAPGNGTFGFIEVALKELSDGGVNNIVHVRISRGDSPLFATGGFDSWNADYAAASAGGNLALLRTLEYRFRALESYCTSQGIPINVIAMLWHQGEADAEEDRQAAYQANLEALIARIREFTGVPDLRFVSGTVPNNGVSYREAVADACLAVAAADAHVWYRVNDDMALIDSSHWDATGSVLMGEYAANIILNDL